MQMHQDPICSQTEAYFRVRFGMEARPLGCAPLIQLFTQCNACLPSLLGGVHGWVVRIFQP